MEGSFPSPQAVPEAISFRQLSHLLQNAAADGAVAGEAGEEQLAQLERLLEAYARLGRTVLDQLEQHSVELQANRTAQQLMALGALGAHIRLGLHALAASRA
jgi:hypothetical protein